MRHPVSYLFYISSLGRRVLASADTRPDSRYWCGMTTDITAQQPGTAALLTGDVYILPTIQQTAGGQRCSKYSFQIVTVDVVGFSFGMLCLYRSDSKRDASRRSVVELLNAGCTSLTSVFPITRFNILFSEVEVSCLKRTIISAESSCESKMKVYKMGVSSPH